MHDPVGDQPPDQTIKKGRPHRKVEAALFRFRQPARPARTRNAAIWPRVTKSSGQKRVFP